MKKLILVLIIGLVGCENIQTFQKDLIPSKNRETEEPYVLEVNSNPGLTGIEKTNKNITEEVFTHFKNRENWRKQ